VVEERELVGRNDCGLADGNDLDGRDFHVGTFKSLRLARKPAAPNGATAIPRVYKRRLASCQRNLPGFKRTSLCMKNGMAGRLTLRKTDWASLGPHSAEEKTKKPSEEEKCS
jgi:hypothetical protein